MGTEDRGRKVERVVKDRDTVRGTERANVRRESILDVIERELKENKAAVDKWKQKEKSKFVRGELMMLICQGQAVAALGVNIYVVYSVHSRVFIYCSRFYVRGFAIALTLDILSCFCVYQTKLSECHTSSKDQCAVVAKP